MDERATRRCEAGFSLVELMTVLLVIGILIAIALATYVGARELAQDRATQQDLRSALVGALTHYAENRSYTGFDAAAGDAEIPNLAWVDGGPPALEEVAIEVASGPDLLLVARSHSGTYWCLAQVANSPATDRGGSAVFTDVDTTTECTGGW